MLQRVMSRFSIFCRIFFVSQCRKISVGGSFSVSLISCIGNIYASEGYVTIFDFLSNFVCLTVPKTFRGVESLSVSLFSGIGNIYASEGYVTIFDSLSKFFCLTVPKNLVGGMF